MSILAPVSYGELIDKLSILTIKYNKISNPQKLSYIKREKMALEALAHKLDWDNISEEWSQLLDVNTKLWDIEDKLRGMERVKDFSEDFVEAARQVYILNDERAFLKSSINKKLQSGIREVKSYETY